MRKSAWDASKEVGVTVLFGCLPVLLGTLFAWLSANASVCGFLKDFFSSGEPLLISAALVGPLIYVLFRKYGDFPNNLSIQFPLGWFFIVAIVLVCVISAGVFGYRSAIDKKTIVAENMADLSVLITIFSLLIFFAISAIRNNIDGGAPDIMTSDTDKFLKEWRKK